MRHGKSFNHLGRKTGHRKAMLSNMAASLILHKKITTTTAKAKALRTYVEPLITKSKDDSTSSRRVVFSYLQNKDAVTELFREISPKIVDRPGGYTRILKTGTRLGDSADMCIIELVDYNENYTSVKEDSKAAKSTRRRRKTAKKDEEAPVKASAKVSKVAETVKEVDSVETIAEDTTDSNIDMEDKSDTDEKKEE
jgi:large subunit ribosomal protein L17